MARRRIELDPRLLALLIGSLAALAFACLLLVLHRARGSRAPTLADIRRDPELRQALVERWIASESVYDSHPDADVARVMLAGTKYRPTDAVGINAFGMREREYALPKPPGTTRVVILGDSFVFGLQAAAQERLGVFLERFLVERAARPGEGIEVLHLGIPSWNLSAEVAFLRRQLDRLQPDLVVHFTCSNDLDDVSGVRGFGAMSTFAPALPQHADGMLFQNYPTVGLGFADSNAISGGFEHESLSRFAAARECLLGFIADLERAPARPRYLVLAYWTNLASTFHRHIGKDLPPESLLHVPRAIWKDEALSVPGDGHWNAAGHERLARLLYGVIRERELLPDLALAPWEEVEREARALADEGLAEALEPPPSIALAPALEPRALDAASARLILGGIDREGLVSPQAAVTLGRRRNHDVLRVTGRFLPDRILAGTVVRVLVEGQELERLVVRPDEPIDVPIGLPPALRERPILGVRFVADDWVYRGDDLRRCVVFQLERLAFE